MMPWYWYGWFVSKSAAAGAPITLDVPQITLTTTVNAPTVTLGAVTLTVPQITVTTTVTAPAITLGAVSIAVPQIEPTTTVNPPTVTLGAVSLVVPQITPTTTVTAPTVTISGTATITVPQIAPTTTVTAPTITTGVAPAGSEYLSIRERILRQVAADLATITGIGTVHRWDMRGANPLGNYDVVLICDEERLLSQGIGNPGLQIKSLPITIAVGFVHDQQHGLATDSMVNRWRARIQDKLADNRVIAETDGPQLAIDSNVEEIDEADYDERVNAALRFEVLYEHDGNSPYTLGTAITAKQVTEES